MATHTSILAWRIPWTEEPGGLRSLEQETWVRFLSRENPLEKEMASHSSILAWRIDGQRSLAGYTVHGVAIVGHNLATPPLKTKI